MDFGILAVAHVVHERDFLADVVLVTIVAIEEDTQQARCGWRRRLGGSLSGGWRRARAQHGHDEETRERYLHPHPFRRPWPRCGRSIGRKTDRSVSVQPRPMEA